MSTPEGPEPALPMLKKLRKKHVVDMAQLAEFWLGRLLEVSRHGHVTVRFDVKDGEVSKVRGGAESSGI